MSDPDADADAEIVITERADLWAMSHGFTDADEMKHWGEQMERDRLAKSESKKVTDNEQS